MNVSNVFCLFEREVETVFLLQQASTTTKKKKKKKNHGPQILGIEKLVTLVG